MVAVVFTGHNANNAPRTAIAGVEGSQVADFTGSEIVVDGTLTLTVNYGAAAGHGDVIDFTSMTLNGMNIGNEIPTEVRIYEINAAGVAPFGYQYIFAPGTTQANGKLVIVGTGASSGQGGTELTNGSAYSSFTPSLNNAVLGFTARFSRGQ